MDTYQNADGDEIHDACGKPLDLTDDGCDCTCPECGDLVIECACDGTGFDPERDRD